MVTMLRPRPGGFCYSEAELSVMLRDLEWIEGEVAVGILTAALEIDVRQLRRVPTTRVVFHRAFDLVADPGGRAADHTAQTEAHGRLPLSMPTRCRAEPGVYWQGA